MPRRLPPSCIEDEDRHGNVRIYYRVRGQPKARLRGTPWTPEFMAALEAAKGNATPAKRNGIAAGTWRWLCVKYFAECTEYKRLDPHTQIVRRAIFESTFDEPIKPGSSKLFRDMPLALFTMDAVEVLRDSKMATPEAANGRVKAMRQVFKWGMRKKGADGKSYCPGNPAREVEYFKSGSIGFHTWTPDEVRQYEDRHPIGTKARLALALLLFTGQRRGDVTRFGRQHARSGELTFVQQKNRNHKPTQLTLPILPALQRIIDASPCGKLTYLVNDLGRPFTDAGFGNKFRDWCDQANLHHCSAHGLRKAGATIAAENGASSRQLMAIFDWSSLKMAELYVRAADQRKLADDAMHLLETREQIGTEPGPTEGASRTFSEKSQ
jgi:integrase